eukprot:672685-Pleurochrysis_carterae.AAC.1
MKTIARAGVSVCKRPGGCDKRGERYSERGRGRDIQREGEGERQRERDRETESRDRDREKRAHNHVIGTTHKRASKHAHVRTHARPLCPFALSAATHSYADVLALAGAEAIE